jgi:hypothetical protein
MSGGNAPGSGWRDGPRRCDGDARNSTRTNRRAAPATLRLHLDVSILRKSRTDTSLRTLSRPRPRQQDIVAWPLLKNQALTSSVNTRPSLSGCLLQVAERATLTDLHRRQRRRRSLRPSWGRPLLHLPRVLRRPRSLKGSPTRVTSCRYALTARTKRYGLTSCSTGLKTPTVCCLPTSTRPANVLAFVPAMGNQGWQATCTNVEIDRPPFSDWIPVEMAPKEGGFRH